MGKREGQINTVVLMFLIIFIIIMTVFSLQIYQYRSLSIFAEDALAASNLASAVIDIQEYGISHQIVIGNPDRSYQIYQEALKINMGLDDSWKSIKYDAISGAVEVQDYIIYNVRDSDIEVYCYGRDTYHTVVRGGLGFLESPNGKLIETTSVYSRISFPVKGIWDIHTDAEKEKLVDIAGSGL